MTETSFQPAYRRVLLKLSGESFCRSGGYGIGVTEIEQISGQIKRLVEAKVELAIVCGGGNILRGREILGTSSAIVPSTAHYMGMLATVINALALQDVLESVGVPTRVQTAIRMEGVAEPFIRRRCIRHLEKGRVVILAGGTGSPFVTTDTAAALRAREIDADVVLKATRVDGIYGDDPEKNPHAIRYSDISYQDVLRQNLRRDGCPSHPSLHGAQHSYRGVQLPAHGQHRARDRGRPHRNPRLTPIANGSRRKLTFFPQPLRDSETARHQKHISGGTLHPLTWHSCTCILAIL